MKPQHVKRNNITQILLLVAILVLVNVLSSFVFTRVDLTEDKRYTLSDTSKELLNSLNSVVFVKVYLEGEFPPEFTRLRDATKEMLDEMRSYAGGNLEYEFIDPSAVEDEKQKFALYQQLNDRGIRPTTVKEQTSESTSEQIIFPGALVTYNEQEASLQILQSKLGESAQQSLNSSIQTLEYGFINLIKKLATPLPKGIGIIEGHGESDEMELGDITSTLQKTYAVKRTAISNKLNALDDFDLIIIAQPYERIDDKDLFIIDQFVMKGGKVLWLLDAARVSMDSLQTRDMTLAMGNDVNLSEMLFKYGARVNYNLALDLKSAFIPMVSGYVGNQPQFAPAPWFYFPLLDPSSGNDHPIVKNLNLIRSEFVSTVDTVGRDKNIKKTVLLSTSELTKVKQIPVRVDINIMQKKPNPSEYNAGRKPVAVLLEGTFTSVFKNRLPHAITTDTLIKYKDSSNPTKMIVIGDGDIIKNQVRRSTNEVFPLGYDRYSQQFFGNKNFILNAIDYLLDDSGLISIRNKEFKLRLLDTTKIESEKQKWQSINVAIPILAIIIFSVAKLTYRRMRYSKQ